MMRRPPSSIFFLFFNDTATTEIYTLSLHDALPICVQLLHHLPRGGDVGAVGGNMRRFSMRTAPRGLKDLTVTPRLSAGPCSYGPPHHLLRHQRIQFPPRRQGVNLLRCHRRSTRWNSSNPYCVLDCTRWKIFIM